MAPPVQPRHSATRIGRNVYVGVWGADATPDTAERHARALLLPGEDLGTVTRVDRKHYAWPVLPPPDAPPDRRRRETYVN
jgi:hypothetical protein